MNRRTINYDVILGESKDIKKKVIMDFKGQSLPLIILEEYTPTHKVVIYKTFIRLYMCIILTNHD